MANEAKPTRRAAPRKTTAALTARPRVTGKARIETLAAAVLEGEVVASSTTAAPKRPTVEWQGRDLPVRMLSGEQIMALNMTLDRLSRAADETENVSGEDDSPQALAVRERQQQRYRRVLDIVLSVLADEDDREWVLDRFAVDSLTLNDVMDLIPQAIRAAGEGQRAAPTTGPTSRARRRA